VLGTWGGAGSAARAVPASSRSNSAEYGLSSTVGMDEVEDYGTRCGNVSCHTVCPPFFLQAAMLEVDNSHTPVGTPPPSNEERVHSSDLVFASCDSVVGRSEVVNVGSLCGNAFCHTACPSFFPSTRCIMCPAQAQAN
jgi:hypothetical protein